MAKISRVKLCVCLAVITISIGKAIQIDTVEHCCALGTNYANSGLQCSTFQPPIASINQEDESMCLNSVNVCCNAAHRNRQCAIGKSVAQSVGNCRSYSGGQIGDFQKDCCEACILGKAQGNPCQNRLGLVPPFEDVFVECCQKDTNITSPSSTPANIKSTAAAETAPLDNPCDIGDICAQICTPTPDSYTCSCYKGYTLMADGISCRPEKKSTSDRCETNNPCQQECIDTGTTVKCSCSDGYQLAKDKRNCIDIDECAMNLHDCADNEVCVNGEGFYYCDSPDTLFNSNDTVYDKCPEGYTFNADKMVCDDIDECQISLACSRSEKCVNTIGSYTCEAKEEPQCPPGFHFKAATESCEDIDECVTGQNDCNRESQICLNTKGNFTCTDKVSKKTCPPGFKMNIYTATCEDINECEESENLCAANEECVNEPGGHTCILQRSPATSSQTPQISSSTPISVPSVYQPIKPSVQIPSSSPIPFPSRFQPSWSPVPPRSSYSPETQSSSTIPTTVATTTKTPIPVVVSSERPSVLTQALNPPTRPQPVICQRGFQYSSQSNRCEDVNECNQQYRVCDSNQDCYNTEGSYVCRCKTGFNTDVTGACADINECQLGTHNCLDGQRCDNTIGSYLCSRTAGCGTGYTLNYASGMCEDDDECLLGTHNCNGLGPRFQCRNTLGSYRCERIWCINCSPNSRFPVPTILSPSTVELTRFPIISGQQKNCLQGYRMNADGYCEDINECERNPCRKAEKCLNFNGTYQCIPQLQCTRGFEFSEEKNACVDINECARGLHKCAPSQMCENGLGYYTCQCPPGHKLNPFTSVCEDIDECKVYRGRICSVHADCINTIGSYKCECKGGYRNKANSCEDINECEEQPQLCEQTCVNTWGSVRCACKPGFTLNDDNRTCTDINECEKFKDSKLCIGQCENIPGSYVCKCPPGYRLGSDERVCQDIDECAQNVCNPNDVCLNTRGGYKCHEIRCPNGYYRDPDHKSRCRRISNVCATDDINCMSMPQQYSYHFTTLVSNLPMMQARLLLFHMKGPDWKIASATFTMTVERVDCPEGIRRADESYFYVQHYPNSMRLFLVKPIEGPQAIVLNVEMSLQARGAFGGKLVAKIYIEVSEYEF